MNRTILDVKQRSVICRATNTSVGCTSYLNFTLLTLYDLLSQSGSPCKGRKGCWCQQKIHFKKYHQGATSVSDACAVGPYRDTQLQTSNSYRLNQLIQRGGAIMQLKQRRAAIRQHSVFVSVVWEFSTVSEEDTKFVICNPCKGRVSRWRTTAKMWKTKPHQMLLNTN